MFLLLKSEEVVSEESQQHFFKLVDFLIKELIGDEFELVTNIIDRDVFKISISGLPSQGKRIYSINYDISVFRMIYDVLYVTLSNNEFFPTVGSSTGALAIPTLEVPSWGILDIAISGCEAVFFDDERRELHRLIYTLCLHFIIRHEIRHIANGHIDYLLNRTVKEFVEQSGNGLAPVDSQTIEMDVDSCVSAGFLHGFLIIPEQLESFPIKLRDLGSVFECYFFALRTLFYCLPSRKISSRQEAEKFYHPNSTLRYFYSFTAALSLLQHERPELVELFGKTAQRTWSFIDILGKQKVIDADRIWKDYQWSMSDEGMTYAYMVWNNWDKWVPLFEPYAMLKLAPPNPEGLREVYTPELPTIPGLSIRAFESSVHQSSDNTGNPFSID
ncbi:hypothetical protein GO988_23430 [Hymenobacter sp. HMF4947]|uniref:Uncharacterized protein n=1 Tax=Hymenobacter ginkgonis TaxID=2682976 RepID=A0A7K1TLL6_9BACT|nr:hypothetical protein [Hymenobacter ginkgonis]MVN79295.1 hypothetical protein [Hymenobacter ginkgonis]